MLLITKELAEAVVESHTYVGGYGMGSDIETCSHCGVEREYAEFVINHDSNCIVVRVKLLLEQEWGIKS